MIKNKDPNYLKIARKKMLVPVSLFDTTVDVCFIVFEHTNLINK